MISQVLLWQYGIIYGTVVPGCLWMEQCRLPLFMNREERVSGR